MIGPYEIIEKVYPIAFKLKLSENMHCHPFFLYISLLEPYYENEFPYRSNKQYRIV